MWQKLYISIGNESEIRSWVSDISFCKELLIVLKRNNREWCTLLDSNKNEERKQLTVCNQVMSVCLSARARVYQFE